MGLQSKYQMVQGLFELLEYSDVYVERAVSMCRVSELDVCAGQCSQTFILLNVMKHVHMICLKSLYFWSR